MDDPYAHGSDGAGVQPTALGAQYNPFAPQHRDDPFPFFAQARREAPLCYVPYLNLWMVMRYDDVLTVLKDPARFSSADFLNPLAPWPPEVVQVLATGYPEANALVNTDPPDHDRIRALFSAAFSPRRIAEMEPQIRALAHELIDQFAPAGQVDLVEHFADPLPLIVIADLLGIPRADIRMLKGWCHDRLMLHAPDLTPEQKLACAHNYVAFQRYCEAMIRDRQSQPRGDLTSALVTARIDGMTPLTLAEIIVNLLIFFVAGHETASSLIAQLVCMLLTQPEQLAAIQADRSLIPAAIEEGVRLASPVLAEPRTATEAVVLGGEQIPAGGRLHVMFASANRDETIFPDPDRFDLHRANIKRHVGFGWGAHFCIGAALARLETRIALAALLDRLPHLRLAPDFALEFLPNFFLRNPKAVLLRWDVPRA